MNLRLLAKILGALLLLVALSMLVCAGFTWIEGGSQGQAALEALLISAGTTAFAGVLLLLCGLGRVKKFSRREGVAIVGLGWLLSGLFGSLPYLLCEPYLPPASAIFESVSGFTTTGSTVMQDIESWPPGILMWRAMTHWLGGIGILVLFVAVLSYFGLGGKTLFKNESSLQTGEADQARIRDTALFLLKLYIALSVICGVGLFAMGLTWENAAMHAMATLATGGFSPHNDSVGFYSDWGNGWLIEGWIILFMIIGSLNFLLWAVIFKGRWSRLKAEEEGRWYLIIVLAFTLMISIQLVQSHDAENFGQAFRGALFNVVSVISTTGFGTVDFEVWPAFSVILLLIAMMFGGCAGSTSGGLKMRRIVLLFKAIRQDIVHSYRPQKVSRIEVNGTRIDEDTRRQVMTFMAVVAVIVFVGTAVIAMIEAPHHVELMTALSSVFATLFNIGPGVGEVGPTDNFAWMQPGSQLFCSLLMVMGRLEVLVVVALFLPSFWKKY